MTRRFLQKGTKLIICSTKKSIYYIVYKYKFFPITWRGSYIKALPYNLLHTRIITTVILENIFDNNYYYSVP